MATFLKVGIYLYTGEENYPGIVKEITLNLEQIVYFRLASEVIDGPGLEGTSFVRSSSNEYHRLNKESTERLMAFIEHRSIS